MAVRCRKNRRLGNARPLAQRVGGRPQIHPERPDGDGGNQRGAFGNRGLFGTEVFRLSTDRRIRSAVVSTASFALIRHDKLATVLYEMPSAAAICVYVLPSPRRRKISISRAVIWLSGSAP